MWRTRRLMVILGQAGIAALLAVGGMQAIAQDGDDAGTRAVAGTGFSYQGRIAVDGVPVSGNCSMEFRLFDAVSGGTQVGGTEVEAVTVANGLFSVVLNDASQFGALAFQGDARFLQTSANCGSGLINLGRQELSAAPIALTLRPGASVKGDAPGAILSIVNTNPSGEGVVV